MNPYPDEVMEAIRVAIPAMNIHAKEGLPEEVVGFVLSDGDIVRLTNQARSRTRFTISRAQMADRLASINPEKHQIIAIYHSHPESTTTLSPTDVESMTQTWNDDGLTLPWVVVCPDSRVGFWWLDPLYRKPLSEVIHMDHMEPALT